MTSNETQCIFEGCDVPSLPHSTKCFFHKNRNVCSFAGCRNQVYARMLCVGHGGRKPCSSPGCSSSARVGSFCCRHGPKPNRKLCTSPGCPNVRHTGGKCIRHGGGRRCRMQGCETHARTGGYCWRHRVQSSSSQDDTDETSSVVSSTSAVVELDPLALLLADDYENEILDDAALDSYFDLLLQSDSVGIAVQL